MKFLFIQLATALLLSPCWADTKEEIASDKVSEEAEPNPEQPAKEIFKREGRPGILGGHTIITGHSEHSGHAAPSLAVKPSLGYGSPTVSFSSGNGQGGALHSGGGILGSVLVNSLGFSSPSLQSNLGTSHAVSQGGQGAISIGDLSAVKSGFSHATVNAGHTGQIAVGSLANVNHIPGAVHNGEVSNIASSPSSGYLPPTNQITGVVNTNFVGGQASSAGALGKSEIIDDISSESIFDDAAAVGLVSLGGGLGNVADAPVSVISGPPSGYLPPTGSVVAGSGHIIAGGHRGSFEVDDDEDDDDSEENHGSSRGSISHHPMAGKASFGGLFGGSPSAGPLSSSFVSNPSALTATNFAGHVVTNAETIHPSHGGSVGLSAGVDFTSSLPKKDGSTFQILRGIGGYVKTEHANPDGTSLGNSLGLEQSPAVANEFSNIGHRASGSGALLNSGLNGPGNLGHSLFISAKGDGLSSTSFGGSVGGHIPSSIGISGSVSSPDSLLLNGRTVSNAAEGIVGFNHGSIVSPGFGGVNVIPENSVGIEHRETVGVTPVGVANVGFGRNVNVHQGTDVGHRGIVLSSQGGVPGALHGHVADVAHGGSEGIGQGRYAGFAAQNTMGQKIGGTGHESFNAPHGSLSGNSVVSGPHIKSASVDHSGPSNGGHIDFVTSGVTDSSFSSGHGGLSSLGHVEPVTKGSVDPSFTIGVSSVGLSGPVTVDFAEHSISTNHGGPSSLANIGLIENQIPGTSLSVRHGGLSSSEHIGLPSTGVSGPSVFRHDQSMVKSVSSPSGAIGLRGPTNFGPKASVVSGITGTTVFSGQERPSGFVHDEANANIFLDPAVTPTHGGSSIPGFLGPSIVSGGPSSILHTEYNEPFTIGVTAPLISRGNAKPSFNLGIDNKGFVSTNSANPSISIGHARFSSTELTEPISTGFVNPSVSFTHGGSPSFTSPERNEPITTVVGDGISNSVHLGNNAGGNAGPAVGIGSDSLTGLGHNEFLSNEIIQPFISTEHGGTAPLGFTGTNAQHVVGQSLDLGLDGLSNLQNIGHLTPELASAPIALRHERPVNLGHVAPKVKETSFSAVVGHGGPSAQKLVTPNTFSSGPLNIGLAGPISRPPASVEHGGPSSFGQVGPFIHGNVGSVHESISSEVRSKEHVIHGPLVSTGVDQGLFEHNTPVSSVSITFGKPTFSRGKSVAGNNIRGPISESKSHFGSGQAFNPGFSTTSRPLSTVGQFRSSHAATGPNGEIFSTFPTNTGRNTVHQTGGVITKHA